MITTRTGLLAAVGTVAAVLGALVAGTWAAGQPERYSTTTTVAIAPGPTIVENNALIDVVGGLDRGAIVETLAGLVTSSSVVSEAGRQVQIPPEDASDYEVSAVRVTSANLVDVSVSGPDPQLVADLANASATTAAARFGDLYRVYRVDVVTPADVPAASDRPPVVLVAVAGAIVAAGAVAIVAAAGRSRRRERHLATVRSADGGRIAS